MRHVAVLFAIVSFALAGCVIRDTTSWRVPATSSWKARKSAMSCHANCQRSPNPRACFAGCPGVQKVSNKSCKQLEPSSLVCQEETKTDAAGSFIGTTLLVSVSLFAIGLFALSQSGPWFQYCDDDGNCPH